MRFFSIDLHIAVIADIKQILEADGHSVTSWGISGHEWVFGRKPAAVDVVNSSTWKQLDDKMCDEFYKRYRTELDKYDAFIVTHTPCFALLYARWQKPIIVVASTRYEYPFTGEPEKWSRFNSFLQENIDSGLVIPLANNKYDAAYAEYFTARKWEVIPSICEYTGAKYQGSLTRYLYASHWKGLELPEDVEDKARLAPVSLLARLGNRLLGIPYKTGYSWQDLCKYRAIIHVPYNASIMSIFEQYTANIPLFFPSLRFMRELYTRHSTEGVMSQLSFNQVLGLPSSSSIGGAPDDPNNYLDIDNMMNWIRLADYFDPENMAHILHFDSAEHLREMLCTVRFPEVSAQVESHNNIRKQRIYAKWSAVVSNLLE